jgi:hypothetical protein
MTAFPCSFHEMRHGRYKAGCDRCEKHNKEVHAELLDEVVERA